MMEDLNLLNLELENIDEDLLKIEEKYTSRSTVKSRNSLDDRIKSLSNDFETLGLSSINLRVPLNDLLQEVVINASQLVHIHRKTLSEMMDLSLKIRFKDTNKEDQNKLIADLKTKLEREEVKTKSLENKLYQALNESTDLKTTLANCQEETTKLKRYHISKENQLLHQINALKSDNLRLKEMFGQDIDKFYSKDDKFLKILKKYKHNEEVNKAVIKKLEENNAAIVSEVLNLKEELALSYLNQNKHDKD